MQLVDASGNSEPKLAEALFKMVGWQAEPASPAAPIVADDRRDKFAVAARRMLCGGDDTLEPLDRVPGFVAAAFVDTTTGAVIAGRSGGRGVEVSDVAAGLVEVMGAVFAWTASMGGVESFGDHDAIVVSAKDGMVAIRVIDHGHAVAVVTDLENPEATKVALTGTLRSLQPKLRDLLANAAATST